MLASMGTLVSYDCKDGIATITMDDGKVNALSVEMLAQLNAALDQAAADQAVVLLSGRDGVFSAGFDLPVLRAGGTQALVMLRAGFETAERLLSFPAPVVVACTGHTIAMGVFLLLSGDYRIGAAGPFRITANEVAIGLTMPRAAVELCRQRLTPAAFNRAVILADVFTPGDAAAAGFVDRVVEPADLAEAARTTAALVAGLDRNAHIGTKLRARHETLHALRAAIDADFAELRTTA